MSIIVEKKTFHIPSFTFQNGRTLPIDMGYETYGTLNADKSNAILVAHYFSASSHCAGKYRESDELTGFWDGLIGPGKAVDTNTYFVICADNLCNCGAKNPNVLTTGPASINPETGKPYALDFPIPEVLDVVNTQKLLIESFGIKHLIAVMGPSFGAMCSWQWAVAYPDMMDKIIPVIGTPRHPVYGSLSPLQHGIRIAALDPLWNNGNYYQNALQPSESLALAMQLMTVAAFHPVYFEQTYPRETTKDTRNLTGVTEMTTFEEKVYDTVSRSMPYTDLNHWIYTCRMCINYDVSRPYNGDLDAALSRIHAKVLAIPCRQDSLHPWNFITDVTDRINALGGNARSYVLDSNYGHMAGILQTNLFADQIRAFLDT